MLADIAYFNSPRTRQVYVSILRKSSIELGRNKGPARIEFRSFRVQLIRAVKANPS
jgi:hypothetical protein